MNCHTRCAPNMPKMCGVNEKLLGEALKDVDQQKKSKRRVRLQEYKYTMLATVLFLCADQDKQLHHNYSVNVLAVFVQCGVCLVIQ